jgi:hypothetical protein
VNRWADQHAAALGAGLDDGEQLLVAARTAVARRRGGGSTFPVPGRVFVLGLSDRRLLFWRASKWIGWPRELMTSVDLDQVTALDLVRRLGSPRLRVTLATGSILLLEPTWGGSVRALSDTFQALRSHRP